MRRDLLDEYKLPIPQVLGASRLFADGAHVLSSRTPTPSRHPRSRNDNDTATTTGTSREVRPLDQRGKSE